MKDSEKKRVIETYNRRLAQFGHDPRTLGWPKRRHRLRYAILLGHWDLKGRSILDYGCGFGDMYAFCRDQALDVDYEGVDINPELIAEGRKRYPEAKLSVRDPLREGLERSYDYAFSSGVHNIKLEDNWSFIEQGFELFDKSCTRGFALNFLSDKVEYKLEHAHHTDPVRVLELAYRYSNRIVLRNDYMPFEFTIFVDKQDAFDKERAVYPEYRPFVEDPPGGEEP
jgi:SAM-dependent methyltransferase